MNTQPLTCTPAVSACQPVRSTLEPTLLEDVEAYNAHQIDLCGLLRTGQGGSDLFQELWAACEQIKSRHNGMPPQLPN